MTVACEYENCGKTFPTNGKLNRHRNCVHLKIKNSLCTTCNISFTNNTHLERHNKMVHLRIKDNPCTECDTAFSTNEELKRHIKAVHLKIKDNTCTQCDMKFSTNSQLQQHIKAVHLEIKNHQCPNCDMTFSANNNLQQHIKAVHLKVKDHSCPTCVMTFSQNSQLTKHILRCTGDLKCSSGELKIMNTLDEMRIDYEFNTSYELKDKYYLRWDFIIKTGDEPLFIEYDGRQHFKAVEYFGGEEKFIKQQAHDKLKNDYCNENGYLLLRIPYTQFGNIPQLLTEFICENTDWEG